MKDLDFAIVELEELEAPGFGEWVAGIGTGLVLGGASVGVGLLIT